MAMQDNFIEGYFTSDGAAHTFNTVFTPNLIWVENYTKIATPNAGNGVGFRWQTGMAQDSAFQETIDGAGVTTKTIITTGGITLLNTADPQPASALLSGTTITNVSPPVLTSGATGGMQNGDTVEIINTTGNPQLNGYQFTVDTVVANTTFHLPFMGVAPGNAGTAFTYRYFKYDPMYYPRRRFITAITQAAQAVVTLSVTHGYTAGQLVVFNIPKQFGMTQLNGVRARILAVNTTTNTITINVDTSAFTAWSFPNATTAASPFTPAQVVPFGDGLDPTTPLLTSATLAGATQNKAINGFRLAAGANSPAGVASDVIYWRAWAASQLQTTYYS